MTFMVQWHRYISEFSLCSLPRTWKGTESSYSSMVLDPTIELYFVDKICNLNWVTALFGGSCARLRAIVFSERGEARDPDSDPDGGQYGSGYGSGYGSNPDPGL
jgi:hypothetical protein